MTHRKIVNRMRKAQRVRATTKMRNNAAISSTLGVSIRASMYGLRRNGLSPISTLLLYSPEKNERNSRPTWRADCIRRTTAYSVRERLRAA